MNTVAWRLAQGSDHHAFEVETGEGMLQVYIGKIKEGGSSDLHISSGYQAAEEPER